MLWVFYKSQELPGANLENDPKSIEHLTR
jgi:hypothetical protein